MRLAKYYYKEINCTTHTYDEFVKKVNDNYEYLQKFNWWKWILFWVFIWVRGLKMSDIPAHHPYWATQVSKDIEKSIKDLEDKLRVCKKDSGQIRYLFNSNTSISNIEGYIANLKNRIELKRA